MPDDQYNRLIFKVAELERRLSAMVRPATVDEVKGDRMRMIIGKDQDGQDVKGPWMDTINHRGGSRERRFYKKGQNLMLIAPNGDLSQAVVAAFAPNKNFRTPDHANKEGQDEETYQLDDLRVKKTKKGYVFFLQEPKQQQQSQAQDDGSKVTKPEEHEPQKIDPESLVQLSKDGGFTARIGKDVRVAASKDGAKIKAGDYYVTVTKNKVSVKGPVVVVEATQKLVAKGAEVFVHSDSPPKVNIPWEVADDTTSATDTSDDDKVLDEDDNQDNQQQ